ncbi:MAG: Phosphoenolpyruvate synthase [Candidatus Daviesbacteria bacterium GW2011_GWA1_41_61]|uniref:Phosphoenolpyruvate synthase n=1 Tax=Candidatus Daviesbacteria bacterium GW2011_GWA2_40_9 TaxID=1618424 RepID=A0A0G0U5P0_9BACT|nr:MAG: Phosphoenolpyruvate synthase [Candidatus Daviesbacteria bacterium GW2011_GWC1_40_9]KKR82506.1 MAG: Phosphoenolpyruvate synthase [Candidatus Daviesbacteria bacterium GW2011_GWA2_40_9]KKR93135.1 MAG: Phosphoenolpyruvate synthase [Candidatus Daviesbacteria bacterium GW2011_GWB1_41_15]KKS15679.1 MAG: Phosphoenolpyruvate synthase [Candidatus Daviesbacteria bacterium GW2011_GWA1_41_61]
MKKDSLLKGIIASLGLVKGKVRVLRSPQDADSMEEGEILVIEMTSPEFMPAIKKAAAIVTDIGGVTCHAAIVSRELGIPCIVGSGIATQVLKDGDLVEVDANEGIVKILN